MICSLKYPLHLCFVWISLHFSGGEGRGGGVEGGRWEVGGGGGGGGDSLLSGFETRISAFVIYQEGVLGGASLLVYDTGDFYLIVYRSDA